MLLDERLEFCDATTCTGTAGTSVLIGDVVDLGSPGIGGTANVTNFPGDGEPLYLIISVSTQITTTSGNAGLVQFFLMSDDTGTINPASATTHVISNVILTDDATAINVAIAAGNVSATPNASGSQVPIYCAPLPNVPRYERFIGIVVSTITETTNAGAINAFLTRHPSRYLKLPDALPSGS